MVIMQLERVVCEACDKSSHGDAEDWNEQLDLVVEKAGFS
jgi:hypothetical protein